MKNTNPIFSLKNFRSFGEEGADFELAPITVLTGCNSSGKSSLVKALMLLSKQSLDKSGETDFTPRNSEGWDGVGPDHFIAGADVVRYKPSKELLVSAKEFGLGRFDKVLSRYIKDGEIGFSYKVWSRFLQEELLVKRLFKEDKSLLNNGKLTELSIERKDGTILYKYFFNNEMTDIDEDKCVFVQPHPIGWDEMFNIIAIEEHCNRYNDAEEYINLLNRQKDISRWLSLGRGSKIRHMHFENECEDEIVKLNKRMDEIRCQWGDIIDNFFVSDDWESTYPKPERQPQTSTQSVLLTEEAPDPEEQKQDAYFRQQNNIYNLVVNECLFPWFLNDIAYIDSSSASVKRLYSVEDENKMCVALGKLVKNGRTGSYVNKWLKMFGIADGIEVVGTNEGIGIMVYLIRGDEKYLLADEGYGITQLVSLFLQMENTIIENTRSRTITDPETFEDTYEYYYRHSFIAIEEPEVHLHPKYQSLLADMFVEAYQKYNIHFIIETHSEYLIRKLQVLVADKENKLTPNDVSLNYVDKDENGISTNRKIEILEDGRLSEPFGPGFFDEADSLAMDLMKYKVRR